MEQIDQTFGPDATPVIPTLGIDLGGSVISLHSVEFQGNLHDDHMPPAVIIRRTWKGGAEQARYVHAQAMESLKDEATRLSKTNIQLRHRNTDLNKKLMFLECRVSELIATMDQAYKSARYPRLIRWVSSFFTRAK